MSAKFKRCLSKIKVPCIRVLHSMKGRINDTVIWKVLLWEKLEEFGIFQLVVLVFLLLFWRHNAMVTTVIDETQRHATSAFSYSPTSWLTCWSINEVCMWAWMVARLSVLSRSCSGFIPPLVLWQQPALLSGTLNWSGRRKWINGWMDGDFSGFYFTFSVIT